MISMIKGPSGHFEEANTFDSLWAIAESLGRVELSNSGYSDGYNAIIVVEVDKSTVIARAQGSTKEEALAAAIDKAEMFKSLS